jgi:Fe-S oxidoreductase
MRIEERYETIDACRFCFMCRHVCTLGVVSGWESDTPRGKGLVLFSVAKGRAEYTPDLVDSVYRCCQCAMCRTWCKGGYRMPETILLARRDIVEAGRAPAAAQRIRDCILESGNPFGLPPADRFAALAAPPLRDRAEVVYYVGCDTAYRQPEIAAAMLAILARAGVDCTLLREETSTGKPLTLLGYADEARRVAEQLAARIAATGCKLLVTACPSAYDAFRNDYAGLLDGVEVLHAAEYVARLAAQGKVAPGRAVARRLAPQDSDYLCRYNGRDQALRDLLQAIPGVQVEEMAWTREHAYSCGEAGGVFPALYPELSRQMAQRMLEEAGRTRADAIATACPVTKSALLAVNQTQLEIRDAVEWFSASLA